MKKNHQKIGVGLLALFFIFLIITLLYESAVSISEENELTI